MTLLILGIGNILFGDEGVGVHFINYIQSKYQFTLLEGCPFTKIDILDGGTLAQRLIPIIAEYDQLLIVDTVSADDAVPGDVYFFNFNQMPPEVTWQGSAHEVEMLQTMMMMELSGDRPETWVLGVCPTQLEPMHLGLTEKLLPAIPLMEKQLLYFLTNLNIQCDEIPSIKIEELEFNFGSINLNEFEKQKNQG